MLLDHSKAHQLALLSYAIIRSACFSAGDMSTGSGQGNSGYSESLWKTKITPNCRNKMINATENWKWNSLAAYK